MKSIGVFVTVLLLFCHDGSKILHNGVGSFQSQSHRTWTPSTAPCTKLQNFNVPHGPDTLVDWNWTFHICILFPHSCTYTNYTIWAHFMQQTRPEVLIVFIANQCLD